MRAHVEHDGLTRVVKVYLYEEGLTDRPDRILRIIDEETLRWDVMEPGERVEPTLTLPATAAMDMAKAILGKTQTISDDLLETLRVERARVDKLIDYAIAPPSPPNYELMTRPS